MADGLMQVTWTVGSLWPDKSFQPALDLSLEDWSTVADIASALVTMAAIIIGAIWAYWRFIRERTEWPKANLELVLTHRRLNESKTLLNATVKVHNAGAGKIEVAKLRCDVHRVLPLSAASEKQISDGTLVEPNKTEANWPSIEFKNWPAQNPRPEVEPGEDAQFGFDFLVPSDLKTVFVYAHLVNTEKEERGHNLAWTVTAFYDLAESSGQERETNLVQGGPMSGNGDQDDAPRKEPDREHLEEQREPRPEPEQQERPDRDSDLDKQQKPRPEPPSPDEAPAQMVPRPDPEPESPPPREDQPPNRDD